MGKSLNWIGGATPKRDHYIWYHYGDFYSGGPPDVADVSFYHGDGDGYDYPFRLDLDTAHLWCFRARKWHIDIEASWTSYSTNPSPPHNFIPHDGYASVQCDVEVFIDRYPFSSEWEAPKNELFTIFRKFFGVALSVSMSGTGVFTFAADSSPAFYTVTNRATSGDTGISPGGGFLASLAISLNGIDMLWDEPDVLPACSCRVSGAGTDAVNFYSEPSESGTPRPDYLGQFNVDSESTPIHGKHPEASTGTAGMQSATVSVYPILEWDY